MLAAVAFVAAVSVGAAHRAAVGEVRKGPAVAVDPAAACTPVTVVGGGAKGGSVIALGRPACADEFALASHALLVRELVRQAMLIAARDELGAATRDEELGETPPGAPHVPAAELCSMIWIPPQGRILVHRRGGAAAEPATFLDVPVTRHELPHMIKSAEALSRKEFPGVLRKLGAGGKVHGRRADAPVPKGIDDRMTRMSYVDQFAAVRALHEAIRTDCESPARLGALARAYALLGVLTEYQWHPGHKVFKARALLYAERLAVQSPDAPTSLWNRAFVEALVGLHVAALDDLKKAESLARKAGEAAPGWVPLIDAFLHYDMDAMTTERNALKPLASLLQFLAAEFPRLRIVTLKTAQAVLKHDPDCFRAIDAICKVGGLSDLHVATEAGPGILDKVVPRKLRAIDTTPEPVREVIAREAGEPVLLAALRKAGAPGADSGEPSWGALAHLIAETRFVHVWARLSFMRYVWGVPVDEYWAESRLLVSGHPFRPYLESLTLDPGEAAALMGEFARKLSMSDLEHAENPMFKALPLEVKPGGADASNAASSHEDAVVYDEALNLTQSHLGPGAAIGLSVRSPFSPYARALMIELDWDEVKAQVEEWKKDASGNSPAILAALARRYTALGEIDEAQSALRRYIKQLPEFWAYRMLAENERNRGNRQGWREALDEFLEKGADSGLDGARAQVEIAQYLMSAQQWEEALPYAEAAAETWAAWAMECAGTCNEGLAEYERAEFWYRNESERYPAQFMAWFLCCKRTHRGDLAGATELAENYVKGSIGRLTGPGISRATLLFDLANDPGEGLAFLRAVPSPAPPAAQPGERFSRWLEKLFLARFADARGETELRDETWAEVANMGQPAAAKTVAMFRERLQAGPEQGFDRKAFDAVLKSTDAYSQAFLAYFAGCFLERHGKLADGLHYWDRALTVHSDGDEVIRLLVDNAAAVALQARELDDPQLLFRRAWTYRRENRLDLALKDIDRVIALKPDHAQAFNLKGVVQRALEDFDGATAAFTKVIELTPDDTSGYLGRGVVRLLQSKDDDAKKDFERCLTLAPKGSSGHVGMSLLALAQGRDEDAQRAFERAVSVEPSSAQIIRQLRKVVRDKRGEGESGTIEKREETDKR